MAQAEGLAQEKIVTAHVPVALLGAAAFVVTADVRVVNPLLHIIANEFKVDIGTSGAIVTAYTIPYGLFQLVYGPLGDRLGKLRIMTFTMALFAVGTAACAFAPDLFTLSLLRFLTGVAAAATIPMSLAYIGDNFPYGQRQAAIGQFLVAVALGQILSTSLGGIIGDFLSWRYIFVLYGLVALVIFGLLWQATRNLPDQRRPNPSRGLAAYRPYLALLTRAAPMIVIGAVFFEGLFFFGGFAFLGSALKEEYSFLSYLWIGVMLSGFGLGSLIYSRSVRWLVARLGENGLIMIGGWLTFACYGLIALVHIWWLFIPLNVLLGLGYYMLHSTLQTKATELAPDARGTAVSLFAFSLFVGQGIGAALLGYVVDNSGFDLTFLTAGIGMVLVAVGFVIISRRISPPAVRSGELTTPPVVSE